MVASVWEWLRGKKPLVDAFFAAPIMVLSVPTMLGGAYGMGVRWYGLMTVLLTVPLVLRRTYPRSVFAVVALVSFFQCLAGIEPVQANIAVLMGIYTVSACLPFRWGLASALVGLVGAGMAAVRYSSGADDRKFAFVTLAVLVAGVFVLGLHMRTRRAYLRSVEERAERLERERDTEVKMAMAAERARIAREMHDVVAHNVSVIVVQADGASYAIDTDVARARQALGTISATVTACTRSRYSCR